MQEMQGGRFTKNGVAGSGDYVRSHSSGNRQSMNYVVPLWNPPAVPVTNTEAAFPVRHIYCVGRNYAEHAREMGADPEREPPFFFSKPADAIALNGATIAYPLATSNLHHEIELVVAIGKKGVQISAEAALHHVFGYAVGLDMTRRDLQAAAKEKGRPWDTGKGFDESAPITPIHPVSEVGHIDKGAIWLKVNGEMRQQGDISPVSVRRRRQRLYNRNIRAAWQRS